MAKRHKLELELDKFSEPSQLSGTSPEAKVHCVVTAMNDNKGDHYFNCQIADGKTFCWRSVASHPISLSSSLSVPEFTWNARQKVCRLYMPRKLHS